MTETSNAAASQPADTPQAQPAVTDAKKDYEKIVSKQPDFSGFDYTKTLEKAPSKEYNITVTLRPRQNEHGNIEESYKKIAWTASVVHFVQILKTADPDLLILRKDSRKGGNPIFDEKDVPDSVDQFIKDYAYDVTDSPYHAQFNIGIASSKDFVQLFGKGTPTGKKILAQRWYVVADRVKKLGQSVIIGFLKGAHPSFVNQEQCKLRIEALLMDACVDMDIIPRRFWYPNPQNPNKKRVPVNTLAVKCPQDIAESLTERLLKRWGQMRKNNEKPHVIHKYDFIPWHYEYYQQKRDPTKNPKWHQQVQFQHTFMKNFPVPVYINNLNNLNIMFKPTLAMFQALGVNDITPENLPEVNIELILALVPPASGDRKQSVVYHTEQLTEDTVTVLVPKTELERMKKLVYNFIEELKLHQDYYKISGNEKGASAGRRITTQDADDYLKMVFGENESQKKQAFLTPSNIEDDDTRKGKKKANTSYYARKQLKVSNGEGMSSKSYSDVLRNPAPYTMPLSAAKSNPAITNSQGQASTNIVITGNNRGLIRAQQNAAPNSAVLPMNDIRQVIDTLTTGVVKRELATHGANVVQAIQATKMDIAQVKQTSETTRQQVEVVQQQCKDQEKTLKETVESTKKIGEAVNTMSRAQEVAATTMAQNAKLMESMKEMQEMLMLMQAQSRGMILHKDEDDATEMEEDVAYDREVQKEERVHDLDQKTPNRTSSLRRKLVSPSTEEDSPTKGKVMYDTSKMTSTFKNYTNVFGQPGGSTHEMPPTYYENEDGDMEMGKSP